MKTTRNLLMIGMAAAFCCSVASAQVTMVYSNNFNVTGLTGSQSIDGAAPTYASDFAGGSSSAVWTVVSNNPSGGAYLNKNGSVGTIANSALLPFTPESGYIYTLSAQITYSSGAVISNNSIWVGMGFTPTVPAPSTQPRFLDPTFPGDPWANLTLGGHDTFFKYRAQVTAGPTLNNIIPSNGTYDAKLILDASGQTTWNASFFIDTTQVGTNFTFAANSSYNGNPIQSFGFTQYGNWSAGQNAGINWDNVMLTAIAVPEPSSLALAGLGVGMMLLVTVYRSRRNAVRMR